MVMFGKGLLVALWLFVVDRWEAYRASRTITLRANKHGVFVARDWTMRVNVICRYVRNAVYMMMFATWIVLAYFLTRG